MVAKKTNIKNIDENGRTPLLNLIIDEKIELINTKLAEQKSNSILQDKYGRNAIHYILMTDTNTTSKSASIVRNLTLTIIDNLYKKDLNLIDDQGLTALHYACIHNKYKEIIALLEKGVDRNIKDNTGKTALHYASMYGSVKSLQNLLLYGTDANVVDNDNNTPLHLACIRNNSTTIECIKLLYKRMLTPIICHANKNGKTAIHLACVYIKDGITFELVLDTLSMIDINELDLEKRSALHYALILHNYEFVKIILQRDTYIDYLDKSIQMWLNSNVPYEENKNIVKILILYFHKQCVDEFNLEILNDILISERSKSYIKEFNSYCYNNAIQMPDFIEANVQTTAIKCTYINSNVECYPLYTNLLLDIFDK